MFEPAFLESLRERIPISSLVSSRVALTKRGDEMVGVCPFHNEKTGSFTANDGKRFYHCFGCAAHGDIFDWVQKIEGLDFKAAVEKLTAIAGASPPPAPPTAGRKKSADKPDWEPIVPVPDTVNSPGFRHPRLGEAVMTWSYYDQNEKLLGYIARFNLPGGGKEILPRTWCQDKKAPNKKPSWQWNGWAPPRPLYGLELLAKRPADNVLIVEGEKTADAARRLVGDRLVVVTWPGGAKAIKKVDWGVLTGRRIGIWPDWDLHKYPVEHPLAGEIKPAGEQIGVIAAKDIMSLLLPIAAAVKIVMPPGGQVDGWDLADAETDGWSGGRVLAHIAANRCDLGELAAKYPPMVQNAPAAAAPAPAAPVNGTPVNGTHLQNVNGLPFSPLGHNKGQFYVWSTGARQVVAMSAAGMTPQTMLTLAPLNFWEQDFDGLSKAGMKAAANMIVQSCYKKRIFKADRVRGRGLSWDNGRAVLHLGDRLIVDGVVTSLDNFKSNFLYEAHEPMGTALGKPLDTAEANKLVALCDQLPFKRSYMGLVLAGWLVVAPLCGGMPWRPHAWIQGPSQSGKSWIMDQIIRRILENIALRAQSNTTEAAIRQKLGIDARPVLFDEAEPGGRREADRMKTVLEFARACSTEDGAPIWKGTPDGKGIEFQPRASFCYSSISAPLSTAADESRTLVLSLMPGLPKNASAADREARAAHFSNLQAETLNLITPDFPGRLLARSLVLMGTIRANASTLADALSEKVGSRRAGDTLGAALAGTHALHHQRMLTLDEARAWVASRSWTSDAAEGLQAEPDHERSVARFAQATIRVETERGVNTRTIAELVRIAYRNSGEEGISAELAKSHLLRHGIKVDGGDLWIWNRSRFMDEVFQDTANADSWRGGFLNIPGSRKSTPGQTVRWGANVGVGIAIPVDVIAPDNASAVVAVAPPAQPQLV